MTDTPIRIESLRPPTHAEWAEITRAVDDHLIETLAGLTAEDWDRPTECDPWKVRDVVAHLVAWDEAIVSPREFVRQTWHGFRNRKAHNGNPLDAQNQFQVDDHAAHSPTQLLTTFRAITPRFHKAKRRFAAAGRPIPYKQNFSGTWVNLGYAMTTILGRDHFMHHIDICRATGQPFEPNQAEIRIAHDAIREWVQNTNADVTLALSDPAGGTFVRGSGATTITTDAIDFCRVIAGRQCDGVKVEGDEIAADVWLRTRAVF